SQPKGEPEAPKGPGGTLHGGIPLGEMFKWLGRGVERITGPASEWKDTALGLKKMAEAVADAFKSGAKHVLRKEPAETGIGPFAKSLTYRTHNDIMAFGRAWKSPTTQKIADMIYPTAGKASPGETFHEGTESHIIRRQNQLEPIRAEIERMVKEEVGQTRGRETGARV